MKYTVLILAAALVIPPALTGCESSSQNTETSSAAAPHSAPPGVANRTPAPTPPGGTASTGSAAAGAPATSHGLGTAQPAGPFQVTLITDPMPPKVGAAKLIAKVAKNGQPVTDASVTVALSMPTMSMTGPTVALKPTGDHYEGTANLSMAANWEAKTTVKAGGASGTTTHDFKVP